MRSRSLLVALAAVVVAVASPAPARGGTGTLITVSGPAEPQREYVSQGRSYSFGEDDDVVATADRYGGIHVEVRPSDPSEGLWWRFDFTGAVAMTIDPGEPVPPGSGMRSLHVYNDARTCDRTEGSFVVGRYTWDESGAVVSLAIDFDQRCGDPAAPALHGKIRINSWPDRDVRFVESVSPGLGGTLVYTGRVWEQGLDETEPIQFEQPLPPGVTLVSARTTAGTCDTSVACTLPPLTRGETVYLTLVVRPESSDPVSMRASVTGGGDPFAGGSAVDLTGTVVPAVGIDYALMYESEPAEVSQLYAAEADGRFATNISATPADDYCAAWSPDGRRIAFTRSSGGATDIYVMSFDGSGLTRLTNDPAVDECPSWSPDGAEIAFAGNRTGDFEIYIMRSDGGAVRQVTFDADSYDGMPAFSPDGKRIAFNKQTDTEFAIHVMDADGTDPYHVTTTWQRYDVTHWPSPPADLSRPAWSPDGTRIAFTKLAPVSTDVWVVDADGANAAPLTSSPAWDRDPAWSADGSAVAFASTGYPSGLLRVYTLDPDGSGVTPVADSGAGSQSRPAWRPGRGAPAAPANLLAPRVTGAPTAGAVIRRASYGVWTGTAPISVSLQWLRCNAAGAHCADTRTSGDAYIVAPGDAGATIRLRVTERNTAGSTSAESGALGPIAAAGAPGGGGAGEGSGGGEGQGGGGGGGDRALPNLVASIAADRTAGLEVGDTLTLTFTLAAKRENGLSQGTHLEITLPDGVERLGIVQPDRGSGCSGEGKELDCNLDFLGGGQSARAIVTVRVVAATSLVFRVHARQNQPDADPSDNAASLTLTVGTAAETSVAGSSRPPTGAAPKRTAKSTLVVSTSARAAETRTHFRIVLRASRPATVHVRLVRDGRTAATWKAKARRGVTSLVLLKPARWKSRRGDVLEVRVTAAGTTVLRRVRVR